MSNVAPLDLARRQLNIFLTAVMFLTRFPVGHAYRFREEDVPLSAIYFPVVGALVGLLGGVTLFTSYVLPPLLAVLGSMFVTLCTTGGLHEDGLADCADGLIGGQNPERRLEIMKDSRIGSYGAIALWLSLTAKLILIQSLLGVNLITAILAIIVSHSLGRAATVALLTMLRYTRAEESKASRFGNRCGYTQLSLSLVFPCLLAIILLHFRGLFCLVSAAAVTLACSFYFKRKIGGVTGDCLGAANQVVELASYFSLVLLPTKA